MGQKIIWPSLRRVLALFEQHQDEEQDNDNQGSRTSGNDE